MVNASSPRRPVPCQCRKAGPYSRFIQITLHGTQLSDLHVSVHSRIQERRSVFSSCQRPGSLNGVGVGHEVVNKRYVDPVYVQIIVDGLCISWSIRSIRGECLHVERDPVGESKPLHAPKARCSSAALIRVLATPPSENAGRMRNCRANTVGPSVRETDASLAERGEAAGRL